MTLPASECPAAQQLAGEQCIETCCKTAIGTMNVPTGECEPGQEVAADQCLDVCCESELGFQITSAADCAGSVVSNDICAQEICCETINGNALTPQSDCLEANILPAPMCEPEVCCSQADGNAFVPASECLPADVLADERCKVDVALECVKFKAIDMSTLPYTTTSGDTLQSITSFYPTYPAQSNWSSSCYDLPMGAERAVAGLGNDVILNFSAPVSSIYILRYHAQTGDTLYIQESSVLTPTFCAASSLHNITQIDLATPSASVTVQDLSAGGGTGYSVLLAECIEWG
jgi:hypothetical protein